MESRSLKLAEIPSSEQTPLVQRLLQITVEQQKRIEEFRRAKCLTHIGTEGGVCQHSNR
jgi:hypothetical protein